MIQQIFKAFKLLVFTILILIMMIGFASIVNTLPDRFNRSEELKEVGYKIKNFTFTEGGQNDYC